MEITAPPIEGLLVIQPRIFSDRRGRFIEAYNKAVFAGLNFKVEFIQDNESESVKNVLRGLHFQNPPYEQGKLIRAVRGSVRDVVVDIRRKSPSYGRYFSLILSDSAKNMLWVPPGFAHGFVALENNTIVSYKCTGYYNKEAEGTLLWNDPDLNIDWQIEHPVLSEKDQKGQLFKDFRSLF